MLINQIKIQKHLSRLKNDYQKFVLIDFPSYKALISNLRRAILISRSLRILHFYTLNGFPYSAKTKSEVSSILELTSLVGRPKLLKCGSIECANLANVSNPLCKMIVSVATVPPVAYSGYSNEVKIILHSYSDLLVKKRAT